MNLTCLCGNSMSDVGSPNDMECLLISNRSIERLQDLVDEQVSRDGIVDEWPEHWEASGATEVWRCHNCNRLYFRPKGRPEDVVVYAIERVGLRPAADAPAGGTSAPQEARPGGAGG
jgi:hypothetical protein